MLAGIANWESPDLTALKSFKNCNGTFSTAMTLTKLIGPFRQTLSIKLWLSSYISLNYV